MTALLATRSPLQQLGMDGTEGNSRRRSAARAFANDDEENRNARDEAQPPLKKSKVANGRSGTARAKKGELDRYEDVDDG